MNLLGSSRTRRFGLPAAARFIPLLAVVATAACDVPTGLPRIESTLRFAVEDVVVPVTGVGATVSEPVDLGGVDLQEVRRGTIRVTPENDVGATGVLAVRVIGGGVTVSGSVDVAGGPDQAIELTGDEIRALMGRSVTLEASGALCRPSGCGLSAPPFPNVRLKNVPDLVVELGGEG